MQVEVTEKSLRVNQARRERVRKPDSLSAGRDVSLKLGNDFLDGSIEKGLKLCGML